MAGGRAGIQPDVELCTMTMQFNRERITVPIKMYSRCPALTQAGRQCTRRGLVDKGSTQEWYCRHHKKKKS